MRPSKKRGESFNVGRQSGSSSSRKNNRHYHKGQVPAPDPSSWPQPIDSRQSLPTDSRAYHDRNTNAIISKSASSTLASQMNRRRSGGHGLSSSHHAQQQQPLHQQHHQTHLHQQSNLLSMKSSPNLAQADERSERVRDGNIVEPSSAHAMKSSPSLPSDISCQPSSVIEGNSDRPKSGALSFTSNMYTTDMETSNKKNTRRSLPFYNLDRYQPDYENVSQLGTAPLGSEKISEIDDIDEVTGKDSLPNSPSPKALNPNYYSFGDRLPTRDPNSLKYIKVNQNHEKYPSWPVTKANGASDQSQTINSRAESMTDHTTTSKEFPQKQKFSYTPGLNPLAEKNSPISERKGEDGKLRNTSDPGFKSEFVYDRLGRVQRRNYENVDQKFDDFFNNSKPGYPPPSMDSDGHNIGDKDYNAPSPPERESLGISDTELSNRLDTMPERQMVYNNSGQLVTSDDQRRFEGGGDSVKSIHTEIQSRPSHLNINPSHFSVRMDSGTSPLDKGSFFETPSSSSQSPRQAWTANQMGQHAVLSSGRDQSQQQRYPMHTPDPMSPSVQNESFAFSSSGGAIHGGRSRSQKGPNSNESHSHIDRQRPASYTHSSSNDSSKSFIVKQTPYYNTSTQTEMMPYAVKISSPLSNQHGSKLRNVETQVGNYGTQTSPQSPHEQHLKLYEEKSIQARMSRDFQGSELDSSLDKASDDFKRNSGGDFFKYPTSSSQAAQQSQFLSMEGIQAKYSTDENPTDRSSSSAISGIPHFNDNSAPMLRKLSEELYGSKLNQMQPDKRSMSSTSSQEMSPRHDSPSVSSVFHQPGMRQAESYNSVVIHHDVSNNLFGRDDYAVSVSSMGDSRIDSSFSDTSSNYKALDFGAPRARNSLDPALGSQKARFLMQQQESARSTSSTHYKHFRENSAPVSSSTYTNWLPRNIGLSQLSSSADYVDSAISSASDVSSLTSQSKSSTSDPRFHGSVGSSAQSSISPIADTSSVSESVSSLQNRQSASSDQLTNNRLSSDSVFELAEDGDIEEDSESYQFIRKPSLRKAYGIYDETERLISQGKHLSKVPEQSSSSTDTNAVYAVPTRGMKYSDSLGLGQIKEEGDPSVNEDDARTSSSAPKSHLLDGRVIGRREEKLQKHQYAWQSESWRRGRPEFDFSRGSNLKRTSSEQIAMPKVNLGMKLSSYDAEMTAKLPESSSSIIPRSQSESGFSANPKDADLKKVQQQAVLSFFQRKASPSGTAAPPSPSAASKDSPSPDSSMYESIGSQRTTSESVSDIISKANENLAKSAQRVDSIRRSNSSSSRHSSDYMEMARHERMRKETEWSRLRSSGSIRYSPDHQIGIRSNRSSYASEHYYEDINKLELSTPTEESKDMLTSETMQPDANMDTGVMASPTYLNLPAKRRPPPPPPSRSPSPETPPPELPPRNYKESIHSHNYNNINNSNNYNKSASPALPSQPIHSGIRADNAPSPSTQSIPDGVQRSRTMPLTKAQHQLSTEEEPGVDNSKRDFQSLMTQWENNSPREERYVAELRRQAQLRLTNQKQTVSNHSQPQQQQQHQHQQLPHPNATAMAVKHSRPAISLATTYKREPTLPQEATSPANSSFASAMPSSSSSAIQSPSSSNFASTSISHHQSFASSSSLSSTTSPSSMPTPNYSPTSTSSHSQSSPPTNAFSKAQQPVGGVQSYNSSNQTDPHATSSINTIGNNAFLSSSSTVTTLPPQIPQRVGLLDESRMRSSSDVRGTGNSRTAFQMQAFRERSSSDHDILADRKNLSSSIEHFSTSSYSGSPAASSLLNNVPPSSTSNSPKENTSSTKWRPKRGRIPPPPPSQTNSAEETEINDAEFPPPPPEALQSTDEAFAEESYIGHKNKSSRPIGTYKRSKSAAVLQTDNNNYKIAGESDNTSFPEKKLAQQSWNSESVLQSHPSETQGPSSTLPSDRIAPIPEHQGLSNGETPPARPPARLPTSSRQFTPSHESSAPSSLPHSSSSSASVHTIPSHVSPSSSSATTSGGDTTPVFTARPFVIEQPGWVAHRDSPRRQPPPVPNSPPFDPNAPQFANSTQNVPPFLSHDQQRQQSWSNPDAVPNINSSLQYSPHRQTTTGRSPASTGDSSWRSPTTSEHSSSPSSQTSNSTQIHQHNRTPSDNAAPVTPPRDYVRRDSAPLKHAAFGLPSSSDAPASLAHRRQSEGSITSTSRSENDNSDPSIHSSSSSHTRQPSQEELECDFKAKQLAQNLEDNEHKLSEVLRQDTSKKRMRYMDGLFSHSSTGGEVIASTERPLLSPAAEEKDRNKNNSINAPGLNDLASPKTKSVKNELTNDGIRRPNLPKEYWMSAPKALVEMQIRQNQEMVKDLTRDIKDNSSLMKQKEELLEKLKIKLDVLKEDKISVQKEIEQNDALTVQLFDLIQSKCPGQGIVDKVTAFNEDQEKIVRLMLNLSGQLVRAENAVQALGQDADTKAKKMATDKLERQRSKYEEAKIIKDDMDKRKEQVTGLVQEHLGENECKLFNLCILKKPQLTIELQDLEDKIKLGREQMDELRKSIPENRSTS